MNGDRYFTSQSPAYARYRPTYPPQLFRFLAGCCEKQQLAWDCATGTGQAAVELARHFQSVIATDASANQVKHAQAAANIQYLVATAENSGLADRSVDLVTVAQALHWFDVATFYDEARRVLNPGGVIAVFSYGLPRTGTAIDKVLDDFYQHKLAGFWPEQRAHVDDGYANLAFPATQLTVPDFSMQHSWCLDELCGYLSSWSAVVRFREKEKADPLADFHAELNKLWPEKGQLCLTWPLVLRVGRFLD